MNLPLGLSPPPCSTLLHLPLDPCSGSRHPHAALSPRFRGAIRCTQLGSKPLPSTVGSSGGDCCARLQCTACCKLLNTVITAVVSGGTRVFGCSASFGTFRPYKFVGGHPYERHHYRNQLREIPPARVPKSSCRWSPAAPSKQQEQLTHCELRLPGVKCNFGCFTSL